MWHFSTFNRFMWRFSTFNHVPRRFYDAATHDPYPVRLRYRPRGNTFQIREEAGHGYGTDTRIGHGKAIRVLVPLGLGGSMDRI